MTARFIVFGATLLWVTAGTVLAQDPRPMDYADLWRTVSIGGVAVSPDGDEVLYVATPRGFPDRSRDAQIRLASVDGSRDRAMTAWPDGQHRDPRWHPSGDLFGFTAARDGNRRQLYVMRTDGGEARRVTDAEHGIHEWGWSADGEWLAFLAGRDGDRQLWLVDGHGASAPRPLTDHATPVTSFQWSETGQEILFLAPDAWDAGDAERRRQGFEARTIQRGFWHDDFLTLYPEHLWSVDLAGTARRLTEGELRVTGLRQDPGAERLALTVAPVDRYADNRANEVYLLDRRTGRLERLTQNHVPETVLGFSPDGSLLAITAPSGFEPGGVNDVFVRPVAGGEWRAVTASFDNDIFGGVWSDDGRRILFAGADGVNHQLYEVEVGAGRVRALTAVKGVLSIQGEEEGRRVVFQFTDPYAPADLYAAPWDRIGDRARWTRITHANPWVGSVRLARYETVRWTSEDGTEIEGLLIHPLDRDPERRYPLITQIHGGPASAYRNTFAATHGTYPHLFAARGYAVFQPNYRGSSNYGDRFKAEISGDYWTRATEDILTGIDHLIERGIAHPDSLGLMGWSAGGHWSNWLLVQTDRFRAISSGAGVANWISLYAQTDVQASREYYLGGDASLDARNKPWDDFDHWWAESPLKYIRNATTPTLIHFGERDPRIPMPQGQELHMALSRLGVPTEFIVYPGEPHGLQQPRNQLVKAMAELRWFEHWIRGADVWLEWDDVLETAEAIERALAPRPLEPAPGVAEEEDAPARDPARIAR